jgi:hypothetical protein
MILFKTNEKPLRLAHIHPYFICIITVNIDVHPSANTIVNGMLHHLKALALWWPVVNECLM